MWRKELGKKVKKLDIQKKQEEISNSINVSERTNEDLVKTKGNLIKEISIKEKKIFDLWEKFIEYNNSKIKAKLDYKKSKDRLDKINNLLQSVEKNNKNTIKQKEILIKEYQNQKEILEKQNNIDADILNKQIWKLNNTKKSLNIEIVSLLEKRDILKNNISEWESVVFKNNKETIKQKQNISNLKKDASEALNIYTSNKLKKEALDAFLVSMNDEKIDKIKELSLVKNELDNILKQINEAKIELKQTKETNLKLIKREEKLTSREQYINWLYEKAWLPIK